MIERAREAGVDRILAVGSDLESSAKAVDLARAYDEVYAAVGMHPHEAGRFEADADGLLALINEPKVVAVGEIGLDYYRDLVPRRVQLDVFRRQTDWAVVHKLPVSVHNRDADEDVIDVVEQAGVAAVLHCFSGELAFAKQALGIGCHLSFAGNLTFPKSVDLRNVAARVPLNRVLVETDAPVLAPQFKRGRRNEPAYMVATAERLAEVRNETLPMVSRAVSQNADALFGWRTL